MTREEFNLKYKDYIEDRFDGCEIMYEPAIDYLDERFQEFIKVPGFKFSQIKSKFNWFCFYNDGLSRKVTEEVELKLKEIYDNTRV